MDNHRMTPENIPQLIEELSSLTSANAEMIGNALGVLHSEVIKEHGCAFASNLILQVSANVFSNALAFVVAHRHNGDGPNEFGEKVRAEISAKLTEFIGEAMKEYGTRDGATIFTVEIGKKPKKEPS
jgi:hypothetical protein